MGFLLLDVRRNIQPIKMSWDLRITSGRSGGRKPREPSANPCSPGKQPLQQRRGGIIPNHSETTTRPSFQGVWYKHKLKFWSAPKGCTGLEKTGATG